MVRSCPASPPGWYNKDSFISPSLAKLMPRATVTPGSTISNFLNSNNSISAVSGSSEGRPDQLWCGTSRRWSYLSESATERRDNWEGGWRELLCTLYPGEGWLLGWDKDTAPAAVPLPFVCILGNTATETKRREITFIRQRHKK